MPHERLDKLIVLQKLCKSRSQAQQLIKEGKVKIDGKIDKKTSSKYPTDALIDINEDTTIVGRGFHKIKHALEIFKIETNNSIACDIGTSTGGFTQYLLSKNAKKVYAIDVGHDQLHQTLKSNPKVINLERTNIKDITSLDEKIDLCVIDLSFISLRLILQNVIKLMNNNSSLRKQAV